MNTFQGCLRSLVPWLEKMHIPWKDGLAYDDFENIAEALYNNIVCATLEGEVATDYNIARYDLQYSDYTGIDHLRIIGEPDQHNCHSIFLGFTTDQLPFDTVKVAVADNDGRTVSYQVIAADDLEYEYVRSVNGSVEYVTMVRL